MRHRHLLASTVAGLALAGCLGTSDPSINMPGGTPDADTSTSGVVSLAAGPMNTFNHELDERDPFDLLRQQQEEGPPAVAARLHSCQKLEYDTLGAILRSRGVNLAAKSKMGQPPTAGELYAGGAQALGAPNYGARTAEPTDHTTASATKLFDIFVQAAPEIIAGMPGLTACTVDGTPARMFYDDGSCRLDGVSCLVGAPATSQHVALCTQLVQSASSVAVGQIMAVATLLAASHTCE